MVSWSWKGEEPVWYSSNQPPPPWMDPPLPWWSIKHQLIKRQGVNPVVEFLVQLQAWTSLLIWSLHSVGLVVFSALTSNSGFYFPFFHWFRDGMVLFVSALLQNVWRVVQTSYFQVLSHGHVESFQIFYTQHKIVIQVVYCSLARFLSDCVHFQKMWEVIREN